MIRILTLVAAMLVPSIALADCVATVDRSPGMHYKPVSELQANTGKGLRFSGHVRSAADCKAIAGARVGHWQANANGIYDDDHRAYVLSGSNGAYGFNTDWPGASEGRKPHVYFIVIARGYRTLITRWDGDDKKPAQVNLDLVLQPAGAVDPVSENSASR